MLRTRIITALVLLAVLLTVLFTENFVLFALVLSAVFALASWECFRLFAHSRPLISAGVWTVLFVVTMFSWRGMDMTLLFALCVAIWSIRLAPSLRLGLPPLASTGNRLLGTVYALTIYGCFVAIAILFQDGPLYLLSAMAVVWVADIGAYFAGKSFGRRKLAPGISPGKSWEGALGGWLAVLLIASATATSAGFSGMLPGRLLQHWGWPGLLGAMTLLVVASVVGDLFESQLKRRAGMKDSSSLLPGHGGVLDRIDALIPVLPLVVLFDSWL